VRKEIGPNCRAPTSASIVRSWGTSGLPAYPFSQRVSLSNIATGNVIRRDMTG
jgi:hypothetical protein